MTKRITFLMLLMMVFIGANAQRKQYLGRGVVANYATSKGVMISWRRLIQDPENATYNIYLNGKRLNTEPLTGTNYLTGASNVPDGASVTVTMTDDKGTESEPSVPFIYKKVDLNGTTISNAYLNVNYAKAGSPIVNRGDTVFTTKYCWPVDLDGDGEMEYIINRIYNLKDQNGCTGWGADKLGGDCLEAYSRDGKHLWTVNLGIHFFAFGGQNDGVTVGDFDGDGKGDICVQVCEGARFWDSSKHDFGKYLYYNGTQASHTGSGTETVSSDGTNPDIDKDGITNYTTDAAGKNPQWYMAVIDGITGEQKAVCPMTLPSDKDATYTRTNKNAFMGDEYSYLSAAMGSAYLDGKKQSIVAQFQFRLASGVHHYFTYAYGYEGGEFKEKWIFKFHDNGNPSEFHHIRIGDVDGDGMDEVMNGACAVDQDGTLLWNSGIAHGDRFRMSDIDPDIPGQEIFAIQQSAGDMLGQILYSATDGKAIKKWYLNAVGDVGRGECMDIDPKHKGYEMWSTMPNIYDCKGNVVSASSPYPYEGVWWDGELDREELITSGSGNNPPTIIAKWDGGGGWNRLYQISREANWQVAAEYGVRAMFWGDIYGDWREELVLKTIENGVESGFCCLSTAYPTDVNNIYCLLQDPNYYGQITNRGYYQSPNTSFYLGYDMPRPQLPPFIQADKDNAVYDLMLGNVTVNASETASNHYFMPVKGQTLTIGNEAFTIKNLMWKSQQGKVILNGNAEGNIVLSEGEMAVNGSVNGNIDLRARGTLSGKGTVKSLTFEGALNYEGGRIMPDGMLTVDSDLAIDKNTYIEIDLNTGSFVKVNGSLNISAPVVFTLTAPSSDNPAGEFKLIEYTGTFNGNVESLSVNGLTGLFYNFTVKDNAVWLVINEQRNATENVVWTGAESNEINYKSSNFAINDTPTAFVAGDGIVFPEMPSATTINVPELMPISSATFQNGTKTYTVNGNGGFSGNGNVVYNGQGVVNMNLTKSDYTGATIINSGIVSVKELADAGTPSSIGAASSAATNFVIGKATLIINNVSTSTNRGITLNDTATITINSGTASLKGIVRGEGTLKKTGAGQLNITYAGNNAWGGTILQEGTLAMGTWNTTFGKATSPIRVTGTVTIKMFDCNSSSTMPNFQNALTIDKGRTLTFMAGSRCKISGSLSGEGTYKITFPYVRGDVYTKVSDFAGTYEVASENCRFMQTMDFSKATLKMDAGSYAAGFKAGSGTEASYTHKIGSISGTGTIGTGTWNIGYLNKDDSFGGTFNSTATVNKYGTGKLSLTGASACNISIYGGSLLARNASNAVTTGTITARAGGLLAGNGKVQNVVVMKDGEVGAGVVDTYYATLTINGNLTVQSGGKVRVRHYSSATKTNNDQINVAGTVTLNSPIFELSPINSNEIVDGSELNVFNGASKITINGKVTITPEKPKAGWDWDLSRLTSDGIIAIKKDDSSGINAPMTDSNATMTVYDLSGKRHVKVTKSGPYLINGKKSLIKQ